MTPVELAAYFVAERHGGLLLIALGLAGFAFATLLWASRSAWLAMAWPLVALGALELVIGLVVTLRTPAHVASLEQGLRASSTATVTAELQRMRRVNASFRVIEIVEVSVVVLGLLLVLFVPHPGTGAAVGLGLVLEAAVLLVFDAFAQQRALVYTRWLQGLGS